jgi:chemotaxis protein MotC
VDLAGEGLLQGRLKLAKAAAAKVLEEPSAAPEIKEKARLYAAAAEAPSDDAINALRALDQVTVDRLSEDDTEIREVAGFIAKTVVGPTSVSGPVSSNKVPSTEQVPSATNAMTALNKADAILKEADSIISGRGK